MAALRLPSPAHAPSGRAPARPTPARAPATLPAAAAGAPPGDPLLLSLPSLPAPLKEKILCMEILGIDSTRALSLNPSLTSHPISSLHVTISFLLSKGLLHKDLPRVFNVCPAALTADPRRDLAPIFSFLSQSLSIPPNRVRHVITKCPRLLVCSPLDQLQPSLHFLRELGFADVAALVIRDPVLLASDVERTLKPKLEFLEREVGGGREMVLRCPALFTFSVERNFRVKLGFLKGEMGRGVEEVREFPQFFAFSLEKRIRVRHERMEERGVRLGLAEMLKSTDEEFEALLDGMGSSSALKEG